MLETWRFESVYASIFDYLPPIPEVVNLEQIISRRAREGRRRTFVCIALEVRGEGQPRSRSHASLVTCACLLPLYTELEGSKFCPEPNQSIRRERDEGFPKLASLPQSRGPVVASIESSATTRVIRCRWNGLEG